MDHQMVVKCSKCGVVLAEIMKIDIKQEDIDMYEQNQECKKHGKTAKAELVSE